MIACKSGRTLRDIRVDPHFTFAFQKLFGLQFAAVSLRFSAVLGIYFFNYFYEAKKHYFFIKK